MLLLMLLLGVYYNDAEVDVPTGVVLFWESNQRCRVSLVIMLYVVCVQFYIFLAVNEEKKDDYL